MLHKFFRFNFHLRGARKFALVEWFGLIFPIMGFLMGGSALSAQKILKLATITPDNSPWNDTLYAGAEKIAALTEGRVHIRVFGNGLAGEEGEVLRKMRLGSVDAGIFTAIALKSIVPQTLVLSLPYFIQDEKELQKAIDELTPGFNRDFARQGYEVLGWAFSGWIYMFYKDNVRTPSQVDRVRLGVSPAEPELQAAWLALGFRVTSIAFSDTFISLQNGLISGFYSTPVGALAYQWFAFTPHMVDSRVAPLLGAVLVSSRSWSRIRPEDQQSIRSEMQKMIGKFSSVAVKQDVDALKLMQKNGLNIYKPTATEEREWQAAFQNVGYAKVIGPNHAISTELYERAQQIIQPR